MDNQPGYKIIQNNPPALIVPGDTYHKVIQYYDIAGPDYESWSRNFNMHFGYCRKFSDIFFLERMLRNMNDEVFRRLQIDTGQNVEIVDLGCGVGTVARHFSKKLPRAKITGVTISDYQVEKGRSMVNDEHLDQSVFIKKNNFEQLDFKNASFTHAYAIESACHANGSGKDKFIEEMSRILQPEGRFCIADGFLKHNKRLPGLFNYLYKKILRYWALPCFGNINEVTTNLRNQGFMDIEVKEISWKIAPSVAYVPWTCLKFFVKEIWKNRSLRMKKERWHNVYAPVLAMVLGLYRRHFGYYILSGKKSDSTSSNRLEMNLGIDC